jgi:DNA-binding transcriptional MerR regulator
VSTSSEPAQASDVSTPTVVRERPRWTLSEAAERTGVSRSTLRRRLDEGAFPHAQQVGEGKNPPWTVTVEDLLAAGFSLAKSATSTPAKSAPTPSTSTLRERTQPPAEPVQEHAQDLAARVTELELELARERARRELEHAQRTAAEALAHEREQHVQSLRQALRMLEVRPASWAEPTSTDAPTEQPAEHAHTRPDDNEHQGALAESWAQRPSAVEPERCAEAGGVAGDQEAAAQQAMTHVLRTHETRSACS